MEDSNVKGGVEGLFRDKIFAAVSPLPKGQNAKEEGRGGGEERRGEGDAVGGRLSVPLFNERVSEREEGVALEITNERGRGTWDRGGWILISATFFLL